MKLEITAQDKIADKNFSYSLDLSNNLILKSLAITSVTILGVVAINHWLKD